MVNQSHPAVIIILLTISGLVIPLPLQTRAIGTASSTVQPAGPGVQKTYWLVGDAFFNWNGTKSSPGPLLTASDRDNVTLHFLSNDTAYHSWYLDFNDNLLVDANEAGTRSADFNSKTVWADFTFNASLGTFPLGTIPHGGLFTYRCAQHPGVMYGSFKFYAGPV